MQNVQTEAKKEKFLILKIYFYLSLLLIKYLLISGSIKFCFVWNIDHEMLSESINIYGNIFLSVGINLIIYF